jgi:hypothetical protein
MSDTVAQGRYPYAQHDSRPMMAHRDRSEPIAHPPGIPRDRFAILGKAQ